MKKIIIALAAVLSLAACTSKGEKEAEPAAQQTVVLEEPKTEIRTVGILLYDDFAVLDAMAPYHVFSGLMGAKVFFVGRKKGIIAAAGMKVQCDTSISEVKQLDILVVPGGLKETYELTRDSVLLDWIREMDKGSKYTASVCTGAWVLATSGLLKGREATTHWYAKKRLAEEFGVKVKDRRFVQSGKYFTSAGVSAGIDMSLAVVREIMGENYTQMLMLDLEYDPQPPVRGGRVDNTDGALVEEMRGMYDAAMAMSSSAEAGPGTAKVDNSLDPVCRMEIGRQARNTLHYRSRLYGFCSASCRSRFEKKPEYFLSQK